jgi:peptide-methionine (S)-S-oxide reductase
LKAFLFDKLSPIFIKVLNLYTSNRKIKTQNMKKLILTFCVTLMFSFQNSAQTSKNQEAVSKAKPIEVPIQKGKAKAYFASGCFWCVEAIYESVKGVDEVINGYAGGHTKNPTYESSNTGITGHAEAVEVIYDPKIVSFETLVDVYFGSQNPTQVNGQGNDSGSQYRSIIFYQNDAQKQIIIKKKEALTKKLNTKIAAEIYPFQKFWVAEAYHQNYERLHPNNRYIQNVSIPRFNRFKAAFPELLKGTH